MAQVETRGSYDVLVRGERKRQGYKYVVRTPWTFALSHNHGVFTVHHQRYDLPGRAEPFLEFRGHALIVHPGYHWDGASGPTIDSASVMAASLYHDAAYQAMRLRYIPAPHPGPLSPGDWRKMIDEEFRACLESEGMGWFRKRYYYRGVRLGGRRSARPKVPKGWTG